MKKIIAVLFVILAVVIVAVLLQGRYPSSNYSRLIKQVTLEEVKQQGQVGQELAGAIQEGDQLWSFGPKQGNRGRWGYAVVRNGKTVKEIATKFID